MKKQERLNVSKKKLGIVPGLGGEPELSPDLVWLLGNSRQGAESPARALLKHYQEPFYRLACAYLDGCERAQAVFQECLVKALAEAVHFGEQAAIDLWFWELALKELFAARRLIRITRHLRKARVLFSGAEPQNGVEAVLWLGFDELGERERMALLLRAQFGWEVRQIAAVMGEDPQRTQARLASAERRILRLADDLGIPDQSLSATDLPAQLDQALLRRWQFSPTLAAQVDDQLEVILRQLAGQQKRRNFLRRIRQALYVGAPVELILALLLVIGWMDPAEGIEQIVNPPTPIPTMLPRMHYIVTEGDSLREIKSLLKIPVERLLEANALKSSTLRNGQTLLIPLKPEEWQDPIPTPLPVHRISPRPLSDRTPMTEILGRMRASIHLWQTAWFELFYLDLGPVGYAGPPKQYHIQLWVSQPGFLFVISKNPYDREPNSQLKRDGMWFDFYYPMIRVERARADEEPFAGWWFNLGKEDWLGNAEDWNFIRLDRVSEHPVLVIDWNPSAQTDPIGEDLFLRFWIDTLTGLPLRQQTFIKGDPPILSVDFIARQAYFDIDLPAQIFNPFDAAHRTFSRDYLATPYEPEALEALTKEMIQLANVPGHEQRWRKPAPQGFDPSQANLTFQFPADFRPLDMQVQAVELFADEFFLGEIPSFNPWNIRCTRSPNGWKLAFANPFVAYDVRKTILGGWIDLADPKRFHTLPGLQVINEVAFSPDSRYLAYIQANSTLFGQVFILDTETDQIRQIHHPSSAFSLAWSPDGQALAMITENNQTYTALIVDISTDKVIYAIPIEVQYAWGEGDHPADWPAKDWPAHAWGIEFPVASKGLEGCYSP